MNAQFGIAGAVEGDGEVDELLSLRTGSGALVVGDSHYKVSAGDLISIPRGTVHRLSTSLGRIGYAEVRFFGKASSNEPGKPFVLSASEIANIFANGSPQIIQRARTFAIAYSIYAGNWGDWEEHPYLGHIYFVRSEHAAAELGGQLQNAKGTAPPQSLEMGNGCSAV